MIWLFRRTTTASQLYLNYSFFRYLDHICLQLATWPATTSNLWVKLPPMRNMDYTASNLYLDYKCLLPPTCTPAAQSTPSWTLDYTLASYIHFRLHLCSTNTSHYQDCGLPPTTYIDINGSDSNCNWLFASINIWRSLNFILKNNIVGNWQKLPER